MTLAGDHLVLRCVWGTLRGVTYDLRPGTSVVGRSSECEVVLQSDIVSRKHARIRNDEHALTIEDLGSTSGTFLDGERIERITALDLGSVLLVGDFVLRLERASDRVRFTIEDRKAEGPRSVRGGYESGNLREIGLASVIRFGEVLKKSCCVLVELQGMDGIREVRVRLDKGVLAEVRVDGRSAADPRMTLGALLNVDGTFTFLPPSAIEDGPKVDAVPSPPPKPGEIESFLNESAVQSRRSPLEVVVVLGEAKGRVTEMVGKPLRIGSDPKMDVRLTDPDVMPHHATILPTDRGLEIAALDGSPLFLNGTPVRGGAPLALGDTILVGQSALRYQQRGRATTPVLQVRAFGAEHHLDIGTLLRWLERSERSGVLLVFPATSYEIRQVEIAIDEGVIQAVRVDDARPEDVRDAIRHVAQWWGKALFVPSLDSDVDLTVDDIF